MDWDQNALSKCLWECRGSSAWMKTERLEPNRIANICSNACSDNGVSIITFILQGVIWTEAGKENGFFSTFWHCTAMGGSVPCQEWDIIIMDCSYCGSAHMLQGSSQTTQHTQVIPPQGGVCMKEKHQQRSGHHVLGRPSGLGCHSP